MTKGARITFYGGVEEIGGNKLLLETGRTRVFLDFGMSFSDRKDYFADFLQPRGVNGVGDFFALELMPDLPGVYRTDYMRHMGRPVTAPSIDGVVVSHAHLDHIGDIPYLHQDIPILASTGSVGIMNALEETGNGNTQYLHYYENYALGEKKDGTVKKLKADETYQQPREVRTFGANPAGVGDVHVRGVHEDHSLPGAHGILVEAASSRIAYTGDFRFHGHHGERSEAFVRAARDFEPDVLLIEGTRVEAEEGVTEAQVAAAIQAEIEATTGLVVAGWPIRDTDRMRSFFEAAKRAGRKLCISTKQAFVLEQLLAAGEEELPRLDDRNLRIYIPRRQWGLLGRPGIPKDFAIQEYKQWERPFVEHANAIMAEEIRADPDDHVVRVDFFELTQLVDLQPPPGSRYIHSLTEPFDDEGRADKQRTENWLRHFGLFPYVHKHASGHAVGPELWAAIKAIAPKQVVPVHTERHDLFVKHLEPLGIKVRKPEHALRGGRPMEL